jgi:hypothetical protein
VEVVLPDSGWRRANPNFITRVNTQNWHPVPAWAGDWQLFFQRPSNQSGILNAVCVSMTYNLRKVNGVIPVKGFSLFLTTEARSHGGKQKHPRPFVSTKPTLCSAKEATGTGEASLWLCYGIIQPQKRLRLPNESVPRSNRLTQEGKSKLQQVWAWRRQT